MRRVVRALLAHQQGHLSDDATLLLLEWRSGNEQALIPSPPDTTVTHHIAADRTVRPPQHGRYSLGHTGVFRWLY